jgi:hypothetical protein
MHWDHEPKGSFAITNRRRTILPLQAGEGRGEGEFLEQDVLPVMERGQEVRGNHSNEKIIFMGRAGVPQKGLVFDCRPVVTDLIGVMRAKRSLVSLAGCESLPGKE